MKNKYKLENRLIKFAANIIKYCNSSKQNNSNLIIHHQVIKSSTSVGANYCEANNASSRRDFKNKIFIVKKELQETRFWLKLLITLLPQNYSLNPLLLESKELINIFQAIISTMNKKDKENEN